MEATEVISTSMDSVSADVAEVIDTLSNINDLEQLKTEATEGVLGKFLATLPERAFNFGLGLGIRVVIAIILYVVGSKLISFVRKILKRSLDRAGVEEGVKTFIDACVKFLLYGVLVMFVASEFGFDATSVVAILGSIGVTIGLALQGSFSNFASGLILLLMKPFKVGDYIIEDSHKNEGTVTGIHMFYTTLKTRDNKVIVVPNGILCNNSLTNVSWKNERMIDFSVGISYESDIKLAKETIARLIADNGLVIRKSEVQIFVKELADSAVVIGARFWVKSEDYWNAMWGMNEEVKLTFDKIGIVIPYNQLDVHIDNVKSE
ncbi:MAG: mechanosensitive ion channel family protein [Lachnospiraceae bacterium]|nr:mechanosensitive ion channel family protein [Lachnospiraceae bacterium]